MKKILTAAVLVMALSVSLTACGSKSITGENSGTGENNSDTPTKITGQITVVSREASSGTRGAFDELMSIKVKEGDTEKDLLFAEAITASSTDEVTAKVEVDKNAIGYTSLGSVVGNSNVKMLVVDGVKATEENVKNGSYKISRPFVLATPKSGVSEIATDFIKFALSKTGQEIVTEKGFINESTGSEYTPSGLKGKLVLSGSTSVEKVIEKLKEEYMGLNSGVEIEITYSGSGAGIKDVTEGKVDIGMSSRALKDTEKEKLTETVFAHDGIAVIVNSQNSVSQITSDKITKIYTGSVRTWDEI